MMEQNKPKRALRNLVSGILAVMLVLSGAVARAREKGQQPDQILSIFFHNPTKRLFQYCIKWLSNHGYRFVSTQDVIDFLYHEKQLPNGSVWVTFDDGWQDNLENVLPIITKFHVPITIFIPTAEIEKGGFWFCKVFEHKNSLPQAFQARPFESLLALPNQERMQLVEKMYSGNAADYIMNKDTIRQLADHPLVTIGSHTDNHVVTVQCSEKELDNEIRISKEKLQSWTGKPINSFAYPNGDHDGREAAYLKKYDYVLAATIVEGLINRETHPLFVPRTCVLDDGTLVENLCHMMGVWTPFINRLKRMAGKKA